ncbi:MAG: TonB-dependent receptor [Roseivirga sp.]|nr:TonB-dependent receptor [Roseivirga sp.]
MKIKQQLGSYLSKRQIYLFVFFATVYSVAAHAQQKDTLTLNFRQTSLKEIFQYIEQNSSYHFVYNNDVINDAQKQTITAKSQQIDKVLKKLFGTSDISYTIKKNYIVLSKKDGSKLRKGINRGANQRYTISGVIKDLDTGETLIGATIGVMGQPLGTTTNEYGFYSLTLPAGSYELKYTYVGYEDRPLSLDLNENMRRDLSLKPRSVSLEEVVVLDRANTNSQINTPLLGLTTLKVEHIKKLPSLLGEPDLVRAILTTPGVSTVGEGASGFNVRGGNIDQNLILIDEAPIYNSSHVWGMFSVINADAIKDVKLYKGGIPARFGGRSSSVLDIRQRDGGGKKFGGQGGVGLLFSRLLLEAPLVKDKLNYLISARRSYFDIFFPLLGDDVKNNKVFFYDVSTKLSWDISPKDKLFLSGYFGADVMKIKFTGVTAEDGSKEPDESIDFKWKNTTTTLRWNHLFSSKLFMNTSAIYSRYNYGLDTKNDAGGGPLGTSGNINWESSVENWILKSDFSYYPSSSSEIRFGQNTTLYKFAPASVQSTEPGVNNIAFDTETGLEIAPYIELDKSWERFRVNLGLRYSWYTSYGPNTLSLYSPLLPRSEASIIGEKTYQKGEVIKSYSGLEPRFSLKYDIKANMAFKLSYNRLFQYVHLISNTHAAMPFDIWKVAGKYIKPLRADQVSMGYAFDTPDEDYSISIETYYKWMKNLVEYKNGADLFVNENLETQLLPADGYAYGLEMSIHKNKGKLTGNLNYTYARTWRKTTSEFGRDNVNDGKYYPSNYDRPHTLNLSTSLSLNKRATMTSFFTYQTGRPNTLPTGRLFFDGNPYLTYSDRNAYRIPDTHRLDLSLEIENKDKGKKWSGSWVFGVYNIYGSKNAFSIFSTFQNEQVRTHRFSVIGAPIPFVTYNFKF